MTLYPLLSTGSSLEGLSHPDLKFVDWDLKYPTIHTKLVWLVWRPPGDRELIMSKYPMSQKLRLRGCYLAMDASIWMILLK